MHQGGWSRWFFFFFNDTATTEIYTLSLHDALPIWENAGKVMIISTEVHLRRVAFTIAKVFHDVLVKFLYCPVPSRLECLRRDDWWSRPDDRRFVFKEMLKLAGYLVILSMPAWAIRRLMRLRS